MGRPPAPTEAHTIRHGEIERVPGDPVGFRVLRDGQTVVPVYAHRRPLYETWWQDGQKLGRWHWEYVL